MAQLNGHKHAGLTLVEAMVVVAIVGILAYMAVPAMQNFQQNMRLKGAADVLVTELRVAQTESIKRQTGVSLSIRTSGNNWCYGYSINSACDCMQANSCNVNGIETVRNQDTFPGVRMQPSVSENQFSFQPQRSTVTAGNVLLTGENSKQLKVVVSGLGRIRICTPDGVTQYSGYPTCG